MHYILAGMLIVVLSSITSVDAWRLSASDVSPLRKLILFVGHLGVLFLETICLLYIARAISGSDSLLAMVVFYLAIGGSVAICVLFGNKLDEVTRSWDVKRPA